MQTPTNRVLKFEERDDVGAPTGRSATFAGVHFLPLGYDDLIGTKLTDKVVVPLEWKGAQVIESNIPEVNVDHFASGNMTLESPFTSKAIGLLKGGWLPSGLGVDNDMIILPDRCTVTDLRARFRGGAKKAEDDKDFLDFFAGRGIRINPLLYALEGNLRKNPTPAVVEAQLVEAIVAVTAALPDAEIVPAGASGLQGVIGIVRDTQLGMERKQDLLLRLAPMLDAPTSSVRRDLLWNEILVTADACGVSRASLVVLALLSSISVPNGRSPAKRMLKLTDSYSTEDAYNALADLRALELFIGLMALFPDQRLILCTGDKNLALFWAGIRASDFSFAHDHIEFKLSPVEALLPGISAAQRDFCITRP